MENDIKKWLSEAGSYEYGLLLLSKYGRNTNKLNLLTRKRDPVVLRYALEKLSKTIPSVAAEAKEIEVKSEKPSERLKVIASGGIKFEDMPIPIQDVYKKTCGLYKQMRSLHEKMKLVSTDTDRAAVRKELLDISDKQRSCWEAIDRWATDGTLPANVSEGGDPELVDSSVNIDAKAVGAARVGIGRDLKAVDQQTDSEKLSKLISRLRANVAVIQAAGCGFGKNADKLTSLGLI